MPVIRLTIYTVMISDGGPHRLVVKSVCVQQNFDLDHENFASFMPQKQTNSPSPSSVASTIISGLQRVHCTAPSESNEFESPVACAFDTARAAIVPAEVVRLGHHTEARRDGVLHGRFL
jgi:hypothetical protein